MRAAAGGGAVAVRTKGKWSGVEGEVVVFHLCVNSLREALEGRLVALEIVALIC